jgi:hypothetical protein
VAAYTRPRPIRVAFLVDENEHWAVMLDAIFANCYSRWGGRFNLPASTEQRINTVTRTLKKRLKSGAIETDADWTGLPNWC